MAINNCYYEIVDELINAGATIDKTKIKTIKNHCTQLLCIAAIKGHIDVVTAFIKAGVDVNQPDNSGNTPLYLATVNNHKDIVTKLVAANANINKTNNNQQTLFSLQLTTAIKIKIKFLTQKTLKFS